MTIQTTRAEYVAAAWPRLEEGFHDTFHEAADAATDLLTACETSSRLPTS